MDDWQSIKQALTQSQYLMQYIIEHNKSAVAVHDRDLRYLYVSQSYLKQYHVTESQIIGRHHYEVFPDLPQKWRDVHQKALQGIVSSADDDPYVRADGSIDWTRWECRPWYEVDGRIGGIIIYTEVINEQKKREEALRDSEVRFRLLVDTAPDAILLFAGRSLIFANQAAISMLQAASMDELCQRPEISFVHPDSRAIAEEHYHQLIEKKERVPPVEQKYVRPDGSVIDVEVSAAPIRYDNVDSALVYVRDITERKRNEKERLEALQQFRQQQKLESIGTLASGVAHEINNPIMGIMNYAQLILDHDTTDVVNAEFATEILTESRRISEIVRNLLFYSRQEKQTHSLADLPEILQRTLSLIGALLKNDQIDVQLDLADGLPPIRCRSQQIQQVLMNLLTNARDALNERYAGYHPEKVIRITGCLHHDEQNDWIRLVVEDHGIGIKEQDLDRLFDPFFTTKPKDKGTGLGLPISYGIVKEHRGRLTFTSQPGAWTRFTLDLPVSNDDRLTDGEKAD